jgi:uncharacterized membrane protein YdjX (TVP38/TMEM64 family)
MPPPVPFKIFVLAAGASGMRRRDFLIATMLGRGTRFFGEALLAAWYGPVALTRIEGFIADHRLAVILGLSALMAAGGVWVYYSRRGSAIDHSDGTSV